MLYEKLEIWKSIPKYPKYQVSNFGNIKSDYGVLKKIYDKDKYHLINLYNENGIKTFRVHRLVAYAFITNLDKKPFINHKDGDKSNNHIDNLEWVTQSENEKHAWREGFKNQSGEHNHRHKLVEKDILDIFKLWYIDKLKTKDICVKFNIAQQTLSKIISRNAWKHVVIPKEYQR